jgi:hypothetical protein
MLKFETQHRMSTLAEFLVDGIPNLGKCWSEHSYAFTGRAPLPEPWMWQESQAIHEPATFFDAGDALFFHQGEKSKKRGRNGERVRTYPLVDAAAVASWNKTLRKIEKGKSCNGTILLHSGQSTGSTQSVALAQHTGRMPCVKASFCGTL